MNGCTLKRTLTATHGLLYIKSSESLVELLDAVVDIKGYLEMVMAQQAPSPDGFFVDLLTLQEVCPHVNTY